MSTPSPQDGEIVWQNIELTGADEQRPTPRAGHSANLVNGMVYIFGGVGNATHEPNAKGEALNDMYICKLAPGAPTGTWSKPKVNGEPPAGRWLHSASTVENKIYIFGGLVDDRKRFNDTFVFDCESMAWRKLNCRGVQPYPRAHHTATFLAEQRRLVIFGGYGGSGRLFSELDALDVDTLTWAPLPTKGAFPKPRFDHSASLAGTKLVILGGRNNEAAVDDVNVLDTTTMTWELLKQDEALPRPIPLFAHAATPIKSAISWKLFTFGGRNAPFEYTTNVFCMDATNMLWMRPIVNMELMNGTEEKKEGEEGEEEAETTDKKSNAVKLEGREHCASLFDPKGARILYFGGWYNSWRDDCLSLNVSGIVGPSFAVTSLEPVLGPLSGQRQLTIKGINFVNSGKIEVKFTNGDDFEVASGKFVSETEISCTTASFEKYGAQEVEVKVAMGGEMFTVNKIKYCFYDDTKAANCIAYGKGLVGGVAGLPAKFIIQAKDTKNISRTSGTDEFECSIANEEPDLHKPIQGARVDHDSGLYTMTYIPPLPGKYKLNVTLGGDHIAGSPFTVEASEPWKAGVVNGTAPQKDDSANEVFGVNQMFTYQDQAGDNAVQCYDTATSTWAAGKLEGKPPNPAEGFSINKVGDKMVLFGGDDQRKKELRNTVFVLSKDVVGDEDVYSWVSPVANGNGPSARHGHSSCVVGNKVMIAGGVGCPTNEMDIHILSTDPSTNSVVEWVECEVTGDSPFNRTEHSSCALGSKVFIFGGKKALVQAEAEEAAPEEETAATDEESAEEPADEQEEGAEEEATDKKESQPEPEAANEFVNEMAVVHIEKNGSIRWEAIEPTGDIPCGRTGAQMEVIDNKVLVYGGYDEHGVHLDDMYTFDPIEHKWTCAMRRLPIPEEKPTRSFFNAASKELVMISAEDGPWDTVETLDLQPMLAKESLHNDIKELSEQQLKEIEEFCNGVGKALDTQVGEGQLDQLLRVMAALADTFKQSEAFDLRLKQLEESVLYLEDNAIDMSQYRGRLDGAIGNFGAMMKKAPKIKSGIRTFQEREGRKIKDNLVKFADEVEEYRDEFRKLPMFFWPTGADGAYANIKETNTLILSYETRIKEQARLATLFECSEAVDKPTSMIAEFRLDLRLVKQLWDAVRMFQSYFNSWNPTMWEDIDTELYEETVKAFKNEVRNMNKKIRQEYKAFEGMRDCVNDMSAALPVIGDLRGECMRRRHWDAIKELTGADFDPANIPSLTFSKTLELKLHEFVDEVGEIVDKAQKEEKIEKNLTTLEATWSSLEFEFTQHNDTDVWLVRVSEEAYEQLEDNQVLVQNMAASRFVGQFAEEVGRWQTHLATVAEVIQIFSEIQRTWSYLEELFIGSEEVKRELPEDAERFVGIDRDVKEILQGCSETPNLVERCNHDGLFARLEKLQHLLELCEKSLMDFMDAKRKAFPRFYFVSTKDLLDILSNGNRPDKVMEHVTKMFQFMNKIDLDDEHNAAGDEIKVGTGMHSAEAEYVPFEKPVPLDGKVEIWLHRVIDGMRQALRVIMKEAFAEYLNMERPEFVKYYQGQIVITGCQANWCLETEEVFVQIGEGKTDAMKEYNELQSKQITDLIATVRTKVTKNERRKVMNIITLDAHARDMIANLIRDNITKNDAFGWQGQLRYRWDADKGDAMINICDAEFVYGYEYLGNGPRLVITPLTDRLYITATQALHLVMGCAPAGPAGTGKTETTKDLSAQLAVACYVFNCSDQMDYRSTGDIFKGLASSGSWGCFDEFNRIGASVLSVCSVQYKSVLDGIKAKTGYFNFPGEESLVLNAEVGAFITMNPGYLGRTELPEGLKALFRPVTVMVPDFELICENMLMAEGYETARMLAHKFVILYQLCRDLLSKQLHYDWGLRAIKSVLVVAGGFKRSEPDVPELALLMRALRDFNIPKIPQVDMVVFMGLITDLFPGMNIPAKRNMELEQLAGEVLKEQDLQVVDFFILKVCQFEELLAIRHCVMLLGLSGCGKSEVYKTLSKSWLKQGTKTTIRDINPKAIHVDEFYGVISLATREWKDGLMSCIMRDLSRIPDQLPKWIILDGDLDANWIESMNSVMDDNRLLTLASNERIPCLPHMRLIFELRDLLFASPATVSRAGVLYISTSDQHKWYITTWVARREEDSDEQKQILQGLFDKYVDKLLDWLIKNVKHVSDIIDFNMVQTLCHLLDGILTPDLFVPGEYTDKMVYELFFCFACVWAFGGCLGVKDGEDHRNKFNRWWRSEWRPVKFPDSGSVFDYFADKESQRYLPWADITESIDYNPENPMSSITVPTQETTGLSFWWKTLVELRVPLMFVGSSGSGKTAIMMGNLKKMDPDEKIYQVVNFNYFTDARMVQKVLEGPLEKKAGKNYGPPGQKKLIYFVDDINMPKLDPYMTQTPIALLRQHFDYGHWYDLEKLQHKNVGNTQYLSCMNPTAGSFFINPRLQRHFVCYAVGFPGQDSLMTIYSTFLGAYLKNFDPAVAERSTKLIGAGLELHNRIAGTFRKTAVKFHYEFNVRHLTNMFQGILYAKKEQIKTPEKLVKLWLHEAERTYCDLLMSVEDIDMYVKINKEVAKKYFPGDKDDVIFSNPNIFTQFATGLQEIVYNDVANFEKLTELLDEALRDYNENFAVMDLVLFEDAMRHICRISRIIANGHALLVGVGGSGKQSLSRLTSFINGATVSMITISRTYSAVDLKNDIMAMYTKAGLKDEMITFMMTDSQITDEKFLVYINDLLASGNIPDLFPPDEKDGIINAVRNEVKAAGIVDTNDNCYDFFITKVKANLHMVLCFSPVGEGLRVRARRFPALVNNAIIDWFHPWPADALQSVSERFLGDVDLGEDETKDAIMRFMPYSFVEVGSASDRFLASEKRYNYTTPKSFLELIALYKQMLQTKRDTTQAAQDRLQQGLDKLQGTAKAVGELEEFLKVKSVEVEEKIAAAEVLSEKVGKEKEICNKEGEAAAVEKAKCEVIQVEVGQKQEDCERDLAAALPAVAKAMEALDTINKKDLGELKALKKPPSGIDDVMGAVICLLSPSSGVQKDRSWGAAQKTMKEIDKFMKQLFAFKEVIDAEEVPAANFKAVRNYLKLEVFDPEIIRKKSGAAAGLCGWAINITIYYDIVSDVEPKKRMLAEAMQQLADANTKLEQVTQQVAELNAKLAELEAEFARVMKEKDDTVNEAQRMAKKLEMAQRLIAALASENVRWTQGVNDLGVAMSYLPGDVLVSAAFVSYVGAFNNVFRAELMNEKFLPYIDENSILRSENSDPVSLLADPAAIAGWANDLLPADRVSIENGCLVTTCARWPLLIDPQLQGIVWIKTKEAKNSLLITRLGQKGMLDKMERCIENGEPVLIENIEETVDAVLGPIVGRQFFKKNRKLNVKLGDKEVEVSPNFKLFLHTKLMNPHYPPEIQAETTLVNFTVTEDGLEDQLLARVVRKERPDLEDTKSELMRQQNEFKIKLKEIEDSLLYQLATAEGDLTENIELIENLEESKRVSTDIAEKAEIAATTEIEINEAREQYRPVATRGSLLFFMLSSLVRVSKLYQFSLASFVLVFERAIDQTEPCEELQKRLTLLIDCITYTVFHYTRRGTFEKHKLTFVVQLVILCLKKANKLDLAELGFLILGNRSMNIPEIPDNIASWMNEEVWGRVQFLKTIPGLADLADDVLKSVKLWKTWMDDETCEKSPIPPKMEGKTAFQKLCIIRAMRPDRITNALNDWVGETMGSRYVEEPSFRMMEVFEETSPSTPVFFLLFPGVNPYSDVEAIGKELGYTEAKGNLRRISMGQGQEPVAEGVMDDFSKKGGWVFLDNIHLMEHWLPKLERKLEICAEEAVSEFRAFTSAEPHPDPHANYIPQAIIESSITVINMPPASLKANMRRAFSQFNQDTYAACDKHREIRGMIFALTMFHACLVGRHKFGSQGWSRSYGFNFGDLTISGNVVCNYLNNNEFVPWKDVKYIIAEVMYGGHITDRWDRRVAVAYLDEMMIPECFTGMDLVPGFKAPKVDEDYQFYSNYIEEAFPSETPVLFGLHNNAEIGYLLASADMLFGIIIELGGVGGGDDDGEGGGGSSAMDLVEEFEVQVPELFDMITLGQRIEDETPYVCVVMQECERMNMLMGEINRSLAELKLGLLGSLNMSDLMEALLKSLHLQQVPANWTKVGYPSLKGLGSWFADMLLRQAQLARWTDGAGCPSKTTPKSVWISGLFNPMAYITAILQTTARKEDQPLDQMYIWSDITSKFDPETEIEDYAEDGMFIHGCCMEGARWDVKKGVVAESFAKDLHPIMPVINIRGIMYEAVDLSGIFECPVYVTTKRGGTFTFIATLKSADPINKWVLAGVAIMMSDDIAG